MSTLTRPTHTTEEVTIDDFITGLLAGLAMRDKRLWSIRGEEFYAAVITTFADLEKWGEETGADLQFWLSQNPYHGDSPAVRDGLTRAVQRDLISLDNPTYQRMRIRITPGIAERYMDSLPGGSELYTRLTDTFLKEYTATQ